MFKFTPDREIKDFYNIFCGTDGCNFCVKNIEEIYNLVKTTFKNETKPVYTVAVRYMCCPVYYQEKPLGITLSLPNGPLVLGYQKAGQEQEIEHFSIYGPQLMNADEVRQWLKTNNKSGYTKQFNPTPEEEKNGLFFFDISEITRPGMPLTIEYEKTVILRGGPKQSGVLKPRSVSVPTTQRFGTLYWHRFDSEKDVYMDSNGTVIQGELPNWFNDARLGFIEHQK